MKKYTILFVATLVFFNLHAQEYYGKEKEIQKILNSIASFSQYYMDGKIPELANCYTSDAKIFPGNVKIIAGQSAIEQWWILPSDVKILKHKVTPEEIRIVKKMAYDYGYYEGETLNPDGSKSSWQGKYVIIWKKVGKDWKIYLDIWNRVKE